VKKRGRKGGRDVFNDVHDGLQYCNLSMEGLSWLEHTVGGEDGRWTSMRMKMVVVVL
jgi:hypothetical protein